MRVFLMALTGKNGARPLSGESSSNSRLQLSSVLFEKYLVRTVRTLQATGCLGYQYSDGLLKRRLSSAQRISSHVRKYENLVILLLPFHVLLREVLTVCSHTAVFP